MRVIKFRGKRLDNGEWMFGNYIEKIKPTEKEDVFWACFIQDRAISMYQVDPKTIGQYTGLKDKNGKEIYEGDILKYVGDNEVFSNGIVNWVSSVYNVGWGAKFDLSKDFNCSQWTPNLLRESNNIEVIGNIHDNPELLTNDKN